MTQEERIAKLEADVETLIEALNHVMHGQGLLKAAILAMDSKNASFAGQIANHCEDVAKFRKWVVEQLDQREDEDADDADWWKSSDEP